MLLRRSRSRYPVVVLPAESFVWATPFGGRGSRIHLLLPRSFCISRRRATNTHHDSSGVIARGEIVSLLCPESCQRSGSTSQTTPFVEPVSLFAHFTTRQLGVPSPPTARLSVTMISVQTTLFSKIPSPSP